MQSEPQARNVIDMVTENVIETDVAIIGAGPAGAVAAALLRQQGHQVTVLEQAAFPRFSIGESLLPQCMEFLQAAGMAAAVNNAGFQYKNGAMFAKAGQSAAFDFRVKYSDGPGTTYQVRRAEFDQLLANQAAAQGADIRYQHQITSFDYDQTGVPLLTAIDNSGNTMRIHSQFVLDASGFGRVLPKLLDLERPSDFPVRASCFTHIEDNIGDQPGYDRDKILIAVHPNQQDVWYWLIPFPDNRCSLGVVAAQSYFDELSQHGNSTATELLQAAVSACPELAALLSNARFDTPANRIGGYACRVSSLWGPRYALLGNAGEFLDPVFSSGVTIAMKSASLAAPLVSEQLKGNEVDWQQHYAEPLQLGIETFREYVTAWYDGRFQDVIFSEQQRGKVRAMICSILAGYAWDTSNPYVKEPRRLQTLVELCRS